LNRYYVADEHKYLVEALSVQPNVFDEFIPHHLDKAWRATETAETHARVAEVSAQAAETAAQAAETRALATERRRDEADQLTEQAIAASRETLALASIAIAKADDAKRAAEAKMDQIALWSTDLETRLIATHNSRSWRITAPLRGMARHARLGIVSTAKQHIRRQLVGITTRITSNQRIRKLLIPVLRWFPSLDSAASKTIASIKQSVPMSTPPVQIAKEMSELPASARKVLTDLKRIRNNF
jgi:hypothetical protein